MKSRKKKEKSMIIEETDGYIDEFVDMLAEAVVEETREQSKNIVEPFEQYAQNLREKVHIDTTVFRTRVVKGYHVLINELLHGEHEHGKRKF